MYQLNGKKINIDSPITHQGVTYPNIRDPLTRAFIGVVEQPDPIYPDSNFYYWTENEDGSLTVTAKSIEQIKSFITNKIAGERYKTEVGGVRLPDGTLISTDRDSQSKIAGALLFVQRNPTATIDWKGADGWSSVGKEQIEFIADVVAQHVQSCFSNERIQLNELDSLTDIDQIIHKYS